RRRAQRERISLRWAFFGLYAAMVVFTVWTVSYTVALWLGGLVGAIGFGIPTMLMLSDLLDERHDVDVPPSPRRFDVIEPHRPPPVASDPWGDPDPEQSWPPRPIPGQDGGTVSLAKPADSPGGLPVRPDGPVGPGG
ncbi:MAG: hypothetical protein ACRCZP_17570, partial [Phycicoccus sp.]